MLKVKRVTLKNNPLKNLNLMLRMNLYAKIAKRMALLAEAERLGRGIAQLGVC